MESMYQIPLLPANFQLPLTFIGVLEVMVVVNFNGDESGIFLIHGDNKGSSKAKMAI